MSTDLTALAVAAVGVAGTMGAPWLTQRAHRAEARDQAKREERAREASRQDQLFEEKRALYAALNSASRTYRSALRDCAAAVWNSEPSEESYAAADRARTQYRELYAQAQMVLPQRPFGVAEVADDHLGYCYKLVLGLSSGAGARRDAERVFAWTSGPLVAAVSLLHLALREDLAVIERVTDLEAQLAALTISRSHRVGRQPQGGPDEVNAPLSATSVVPTPAAAHQRPNAAAETEQAS